MSVAAAVASVIRELLQATNADGTPNLLLREKGAALALKHPTYLEAAEEEAGEDLLPEGVLLVYPVPPEARGQVDDSVQPAPDTDRPRAD